jgi:hypothetical protein
MSVIADFLVNGSSLSVVGGTGTAKKYFPRTLGPSIGVAPLTPSSTSSVGQLAVPGQNVLNGKLFSVIAAGSFIAGASAGSETVTLVVDANTAAPGASASYTNLATSTAFAPPVDGVEHSFLIKLDLYGDNLSGIVGGVQTVMIDGVLNNSTPKNSANVLSSINFNGGISGSNGVPFGLVVGVTFSVSNASNSASLSQFQIVDAN